MEKRSNWSYLTMLLLGICKTWKQNKIKINYIEADIRVFTTNIMVNQHVNSYSTENRTDRAFVNIALPTSCVSLLACVVPPIWNYEIQPRISMNMIDTIGESIYLIEIGNLQGFRDNDDVRAHG